MSCKLKLFLPLIIVIAAFGAIINCYWLPNALDLEKQGWHLRQEVTAEILASNVPRLLLAANSPQLSATLDTILKKHREWRALTLRSPDGRILYRATSPPHPAAPEPNLLQLDLTENNKVIGTLSVELEQHALWQRTQRALQRFVFISMAFFLAVALLNHMLNEIWLWRPLAKLQHAAHHLAHGDYSATPPPSSPHAELGELIESFKLLCSNFQSREKQFQRQAALSETVRMIQAQFITDYPYTTELHSVLNTIIKLTTSEMGLIGELLARDQHGYNLKIVAAKNLAGASSALSPTPGSGGSGAGQSAQHRTFLTQIIDSGHPWISNDVAPGTDLPFCSEEKITSCLTVPLYSATTPTGVIILCNQPEGYERKIYDELRIIFESLGNLLSVNRANQDLREKEQRLRVVLDHAMEGIVAINDQGTIETFNLAAEKIFGYRASEIIGQKIGLLMPPSSGQDRYLHSYLQNRTKKFIGRGREVQGRRKNGTIFPLELSVSEIILAERRIFTGIIRDITERKKIETALRRERDFSRAVVECAGTIIVVLAKDGMIVRLNKAGERLTGYTHAEVVGKDIFGLFIPPAEVAEALKIFAELCAGIFPQEQLHHWRTKHGALIPIAWVNTCIVNDRDEVEHIIAIGIDITERKKLEEKIRKVKESLDLAQSIAHLGNWDWDISNNTLWWSDEIYRIFGLLPQSFAATYEAFLKAVHPDDREPLEKAVAHALATGNKYEIDHRIVFPDGTIRIVHEQARVIRGHLGQPSRMLGTVQDVTELRETQRRLEKAYAKLNEYIEVVNQNVLILHTDSRGIITNVSEAFCRISGYSAAELLDKPVTMVHHHDTPKQLYQEIQQTITAGKIWRGELLNRCKNGSDYWVDLSITPNFNESGMIIGYTSIQHDISDKKNIEKIAITDALTGLHNRRHFNYLFPQEMGRARRGGKNLIFIMFDVDHFKLYNDTYGHQRGDDVLIAIGKSLKGFLRRGGDFSFRLGGEEFGILLEDMTAEEAFLFADSYRQLVENLRIEHRHNSIGPYVTISMGMTVVAPESATSVDEVVKKADDALYEAKHSGRNQVAIA